MIWLSWCPLLSYVPTLLSENATWTVPELNKVNFKEAKAAKKLWHGEVARLDDVTFSSGWERCDVPSPNIWIERQPKLAFMHTCTVCVQCTANEHNIHKQSCTNIMDHRQLFIATYTQTKVSQYVLQYNKLPHSILQQSTYQHPLCLQSNTAYTTEILHIIC